MPLNHVVWMPADAFEAPKLKHHRAAKACQGVDGSTLDTSNMFEALQEEEVCVPALCI